ncbi:DNA polymerase zeta catalytic subunit isoform X2 [Eucalyptus grandis]|uniref:DNA polymerase zeta catalytic subunit isoform X2 n=1 Tax=Eucalyptus grandis TaxID=71139 RepID=UPI0008A0C87E|nr:DNA polymerase zeta catalytic subunit isoform X2 [Eucalyptus grandis]
MVQLLLIKKLAYMCIRLYPICMYHVQIFLSIQRLKGMHLQMLSLAMEKALKLKGNAGVKWQHVHGCSLVRARRFYGYHASEELFVKIYLYHPHDVSRAAKLLLGGAVFDRSLLWHESHIPYLLQFLVDYNLFGMGLLHLMRIRFRHPIPDIFAPKICSDNDQGRQVRMFVDSQ